MEDKFVKVMKLKELNTLVIRQSKNSTFFIISDDGIIISIPNLATLLKYLIFSGTIDAKLLEGILSEYYEVYK